MNIFQIKIYRLFCFIFMFMGFLSCEKREAELVLPEGMLSEIPLEFTTFVDVVKANTLVNSSVDLQSYPISILADASIDGTHYPVFNNDRLDYADDAWSYGTVKYWIPGASYHFAAFAPFIATDDTGSGIENTLSNGTPSFFKSLDGKPVLIITDYNTGKFTSGSTVIDARSEDLLAAHHSRDNTHLSDYSAVPLNFEHLLSCVSFSIRNTTNNDITKVSAISLNGLKYKCDISLNTTSVSVTPSAETGSMTSSERIPETGAAAFLPKGMAETDYKNLFDCEILTLLPQVLYGNNIILTFKVHKGTNDTNGTDYSYNLGNIEALREWKAGKKYNYNISITSTDILFQVVEVPWIEHEVEL